MGRKGKRMNITGFNHAAFNVESKLAESVDFYANTLGLRRLERSAMASRVKGAWFQVGDHAQLHVADETWDGSPRNPIGPHVSFYVDDIVEARSELEEKGLTVFVLGEGVSQVMWFSDPAGNTVELQQTQPTPVSD
jgi:catechol 2,3-dioxygenase-like lactoylglutathione lyase family enzyme